MSRNIVPEMAAKEPWMTEELQEKLRQIASDGKISCAQAHLFARDQSIELKKIKPLLDACGVKLKECQLGCF
jgi:hypothetical protein